MDREYYYNNTLDKYQNEDFINFVTKIEIIILKIEKLKRDLEKL